MTNSNEKKHAVLPALDGVRGLACLLVIFDHAGYNNFLPLVVGIGTFGVMIFFALSGFLMAYHYLPDVQSARYWLKFIAHRFVRLYPPFVVALLGYLILLGHMPSGFPFANPTAGFADLIRSLSLSEYRGVLWTIPVELKFYLFYPAIAWFIALRSGKAKTAGITIIGVGLAWFYLQGTATSILLVSYFAFFAAGAAAGAAYKSNFLTKVKTVYWNILAGVCVVANIFVVYDFRYLNIAGQHIWTYGWAYAPLLALSLVSIAKSKGAISRLFAHPASRWIGERSYSVYLVHFFVIQAFVVAAIPVSWFILPAVFLVALPFYYFIERPSARLAKRAGRFFGREPQVVLATAPEALNRTE
jgi:peptidoglycan/LPS O-acetylase OafA/YrhL